MVALLAEGVDRNTDLGADVDNAQKSPSSRRAWIEMLLLLGNGLRREVALLAEGVDRNRLPPPTPQSCYSRPPRGGRG